MARTESWDIATRPINVTFNPERAQNMNTGNGFNDPVCSGLSGLFGLLLLSCRKIMVFATALVAPFVSSFTNPMYDPIQIQLNVLRSPLPTTATTALRMNPIQDLSLRNDVRHS